VQGTLELVPFLGASTFRVATVGTNFAAAAETAEADVVVPVGRIWIVRGFSWSIEWGASALGQGAHVAGFITGVPKVEGFALAGTMRYFQSNEAKTGTQGNSTTTSYSGGNVEFPQPYVFSSGTQFAAVMSNGSGITNAGSVVCSVYLHDVPA